MNLTELNRRWLDQRFSRPKDGTYLSHGPIYGLEDKEHTEGDPTIWYGRILQVLCILDRMTPIHKLLDVGGAEGFLARLVQKIFGARVVNFDLSKEANYRAREIFNLDGVSGVAHELPFMTGAFDVVTCIEVIEHLQAPLQSILELDRVASKHLIVSSLNFSSSQEDREKRLATRRFGPHFDRNYFLKKDFETLLGRKDLIGMDQCAKLDIIENDNVGGVQEARRVSRRPILRIRPHDEGSTEALIIVKSKAVPLAEKGSLPEERLLDGMVAETVQPERVLFLPPDDLPHDLFGVLCCPDCRIHSRAENELIVSADRKMLVCEANLHLYPIENGVPLLYPEEGLAPRPLETILDSTRYVSDELQYISELDRQLRMPGECTQTIGFINSPLPNSIVRGDIRVSGWVVDLRAASELQVEASVDGTAAGSTKNSVPRQDVADFFRTLQVRVPRKSGFIISLDSKMLSYGNHILRVLGRNSCGEVFEIGQVQFQYSS